MPRAMQSPITTLEVLQLIAENQPLGVADATRLLGRPKSSVQRAMVTLHDAGWIRPDGSERTRWVLTGKVLEIARHVGNDTGLRQAARPIMERLRAETGESVVLSLREGFQSVTTDILEASHMVRYVRTTGLHLPLHAGASGKVMLANLPEAELEQYLSVPLAGFTERTLTDPRKLRSDLVKIREQRYAISRAEVTPDAAGVAAVVRAHGEPIASVSVGAPISRFTDATAVTYATERVIAAADDISNALA